MTVYKGRVYNIFTICRIFPRFVVHNVCRRYRSRTHRRHVSTPTIATSAPTPALQCQDPRRCHVTTPDLPVSPRQHAHDPLFVL
jgi:hypothetical protein